MDVRHLVEVVAVLTDVVQLGVDGGVVFTPTLFRHAPIPLAVISYSFYRVAMSQGLGGKKSTQEIVTTNQIH